MIVFKQTKEGREDIGAGVTDVDFLIDAVEIEDRSKDIVRVLVEDKDGRKAVLWLSVREVKGGIRGTVTVRVGSKEVARSATARWREKK